MEEDKQVLNYRGLSRLVERLKQYFIKNPKNRATGKYLKCSDDSGNVEWAEFPALLTFKGTVASYQALTNIENPSVGDVWKVEENVAEYVWIENSDKSEGAAPFIWEYLGGLVNLTTHAGITDTATAGQVLVSKSNGAEGITYEWITLSDSDIHQSIATSNNKMYLTGVEDNSGIPTGALTGVANYGVYATNGSLHLTGNISHNCLKYIRGSAGSVDITYMSPKYIIVECNYEGGLDINLNQEGSFDGVKEVVCRINNTSPSEEGWGVAVIVNYYNESGSKITNLKNFYNSIVTSSSGLSITPGLSMELVFTFWGVNDVTFNGGINV